MRKPTDTCLLCKANSATKKNSHIYPKFLSTNFLGPKGAPRRGYDLSSDKIAENKPRVIQDSPKEDYILCEECEAYFGVLEGIASQVFGSWEQKATDGEFSRNKIIEGLQMLEVNNVHNQTIHLFIYSIFWRVSISLDPFFKNVNIADEFEEELRQLLMLYRHANKTDYLNAVSANPSFKIFPWTAMTADSFKDETANLLFAPFSYDPYCILVDRFSFMLFRSPDDIKQDFFKGFSNLQMRDCRMMILSQELWHDAILKKPYELLVKQAVESKKK